MHTNTENHQTNFQFCVEDAAAIATLEQVLAIVRRLGLRLCGIRASATAQGVDVSLRLAAAEEGALVLCRMRLHNVVGILSIREMPALVITRPPRQA